MLCQSTNPHTGLIVQMQCLCMPDPLFGWPGFACAYDLGKAHVEFSHGVGLCVHVPVSSASAMFL
eukprot:c21664_g1_i1 orf=45-239(-)